MHGKEEVQELVFGNFWKTLFSHTLLDIFQVTCSSLRWMLASLLQHFVLCWPQRANILLIPLAADSLVPVSMFPLFYIGLSSRKVFTLRPHSGHKLQTGGGDGLQGPELGHSSQNGLRLKSVFFSRCWNLGNYDRISEKQLLPSLGTRKTEFSWRTLGSGSNSKNKDWHFDFTLIVLRRKRS